MSGPEGAVQVTVFWRPGCPWCARLRRGLRRARIATVERNIWEDADAAATVRAAAGGNETVPTVVIGDVALVNPSLAAVRRALVEASRGAAQVQAWATPPRGAPTAPAPSNGATRVRRVLRRLRREP